MEGAKKKKKAGEIELEAGGGEVVEEGKRIHDLHRPRHPSQPAAPAGVLVVHRARPEPQAILNREENQRENLLQITVAPAISKGI